MENILLLTDGYKHGHHMLYPSGTNKVYSYFESRGGPYNQVVFFGLQYILKKWFVGQVVTHQKINEAKEVLANTPEIGAKCIFNEAGWRYILNEHEGKLPLKIRAVQEGSVIPVKNALVTVENTDPKLPWLPGFVEGLIVQLWYPMTVATRSWHWKKTLLKYYRETSDYDSETLALKVGKALSDFGFRGSTSVESAGIGGAAFRVNFAFADNIQGKLVERKYYNSDEKFVSSILAAEHSTMTSWGRLGEEEAARQLVNTGVGIIALVCDSYDLQNFLHNILGHSLKSVVVNLEKEGRMLSVRPDSGQPDKVVVDVLNTLDKLFGPCRVNKKGFKELPPYLKVVQGDGICEDNLDTVLGAIKAAGWAIENVKLGSGGGMLQKLDRDTMKCAFKASYLEVEGVGRSIYKEPKTDLSKTSKKGKLSLIMKNDGAIETVQEASKENQEQDLMRDVFINGNLLVNDAMSNIKTRAWHALMAYE